MRSFSLPASLMCRFFKHAQAVHVEEGLALRWQATEAVGDLFEHGVDLFGLARAGQALVEREPDVHVAAIAVG